MPSSVLLRLVILGLLAMPGCRMRDQDGAGSEQQPQVEATTFGKNASFTIDGTLITLVDGVSEAQGQADSTTATTRYLGKESEGDLNGDGSDDVAFWVVQDAGGSGTFYHVVVGLRSATGYTTTNAFLVGDRITPESLQIRTDAQELHVYFTDRKSTEPMTTPPSEPKVLLLKVTPEGRLAGLMSR